MWYYTMNMICDIKSLSAVSFNQSLNGLLRSKNVMCPSIAMSACRAELTMTSINDFLCLCGKKLQLKGKQIILYEISKICHHAVTGHAKLNELLGLRNCIMYTEYKCLFNWVT